MKGALILFVAVLGVRAQTVADMSKRVMNLGQTFASQAEVEKISKCLEVPLYQQKPVDDLKKDAIGCAAKSINPLKYASGMSTLGKLDKCLAPDTWMTLIDKVYTTSYPIFKPLLTKCNDSLTKCKKNKKKQAQCIKQGYKLLLSDVATKAVIDDLCKKIVKKSLNKKQWACVLQYAGQVVDLSKYTCAKIQPAA